MCVMWVWCGCSVCTDTGRGKGGGRKERNYNHYGLSYNPRTPNERKTDHTQHTGTIKPFHTSMLDSSTSMFLNTFIPLLRMSSNSCNDKHTDTSPVQPHPCRLQAPSRKLVKGWKVMPQGADTRLFLVVHTPSVRLLTGMSLLSFVDSQAAKNTQRNRLFLPFLDVW